MSWHYLPKMDLGLRKLNKLPLSSEAIMRLKPTAGQADFATADHSPLRTKSLKVLAREWDAAMMESAPVLCEAAELVAVPAYLRWSAE